MDEEKNQLQEIAKLSDIIRKKYERIKYNKFSVENNVKQIFKPVVDPLEKLIDISNDTIKKENVKVKQENNQIKHENDSPNSRLMSKNYYNQDSDADDLMTSFKSANDIEDEHYNESTTSNASPYKNLSQTPFNELINLDTKKNKLLEKVENGDEEIDLEVGVRKTQSGKFMFGNKQIKFENNQFTIGDKSYTLTEGILELLFKKAPNMNSITSKDYEIMEELVLMTNAHKKSYWSTGKIRTENLKLKNCLSFILDKFGKGLIHSRRKVKKNFLTDYKRYNTNEIHYVYWNDINELVDRLKLLIASQTAGNNSHTNEIVSIIEELREADVIY